MSRRDIKGKDIKRIIKTMILGLENRIGPILLRKNGTDTAHDLIRAYCRRLAAASNTKDATKRLEALGSELNEITRALSQVTPATEHNESEVGILFNCLHKIDSAKKQNAAFAIVKKLHQMIEKVVPDEIDALKKVCGDDLLPKKLNEPTHVALPIYLDVGIKGQLTEAPPAFSASFKNEDDDQHIYETVAEDDYDNIKRQNPSKRLADAPKKDQKIYRSAAKDLTAPSTPQSTRAQSALRTTEYKTLSKHTKKKPAWTEHRLKLEPVYDNHAANHPKPEPTTPEFSAVRKSILTKKGSDTVDESASDNTSQEDTGPKPK